MAAQDDGTAVHALLELSFDSMQPLGVKLHPVFIAGDKENNAYSGPPDADPRKFWVHDVAGQVCHLLCFSRCLPHCLCRRYDVFSRLCTSSSAD